MPSRGQRTFRSAAANKPEYRGGALGAACRKTRLCHLYVLGQCPKESDCKFAHGEGELRTLPDLTRTRMCPKLVSSGYCDAAACRYAHGANELVDMRRAPRLQTPTPPQNIHAYSSVSSYAPSYHAVSPFNHPQGFTLDAAATFFDPMFSQSKCLQFQPSLFDWAACSSPCGVTIPVQTSPGYANLFIDPSGFSSGTDMSIMDKGVASGSECAERETECGETSTADSGDSTGSVDGGCLSDTGSKACHKLSDWDSDDACETRDVELTIYHSFVHLKMPQLAGASRRSRSLPCSWS